jgi:hypothetical protein
VSFWTALAVEDPTKPTIINISIENQATVIHHFFSPPGPGYCTNPLLIEGKFDLAPGVYPWRASYLQYTATGTVTITRGVCVLVEIVF